MTAALRLPAYRDPMADVLIGLAIGALGTAFILAAGIGLYILKSKLGINLLPGPSPLHELYVMLR